MTIFPFVAKIALLCGMKKWMTFFFRDLLLDANNCMLFISFLPLLSYLVC